MWRTGYWILGPGYRKQVTVHKSQDQAEPLLTGRTLKHRSSSKAELNTFPAASIRGSVITRTSWLPLKVHHSALGTTVPPAGDPCPDNITGLHRQVSVYFLKARFTLFFQSIVSLCTNIPLCTSAEKKNLSLCSGASLTSAFFYRKLFHAFLVSILQDARAVSKVRKFFSS